MTERVPPEFFTPELLGRVATVLCKLSPPGEVLLSHLDAPLWFVLAVRDGVVLTPDAEGSKKRWNVDVSEGPLVVDGVTVYQDKALSLSGGDLGAGITWFWRGGPRFTLSGQSPQGVGWDEIRGLVSILTPPLIELLTFRT